MKKWIERGRIGRGQACDDANHAVDVGSDDNAKWAISDGGQRICGWAQMMGRPTQNN